MQWRTGPFSAPFGQNSPDAKRTILVTADVPLGAGNVAVEVELDGRMLDTATDSPTAIEAALPESRVTLIRAGRTVVGVQIQVPQASPALRITPYLQPKETGATSTLPVEMQISVDGPNQPRVTAVTLLDSAASGASVTAQPDGAVLVQAGTQSPVEVLVANGRRSFAAPVPPGGTANVSPASEGVAGIQLSAQGVQDFEYQIKAGKSGDDVTTTSAVLKSGRWRVLGKSTQAVTQVAPKPRPTAESLPPSTVATPSAGNPTASQTSVAPTESVGPTTSSAASASPSTTVTTKPSASVKPTTNTKPTKSPKPTASTKPSSSTYPTTSPKPTPTYTIVPVPTQPTVAPSVPVIPPSVTPQPTPTPTPTPTTKPSVTESPTARPVPTFSVVIPKPTITFQLP